MTIHLFIPAEDLNQEWSCFNIGNKLFADFFQKKFFTWLSQWNFFPCKVLAKSQSPNYLTSFSSAQSEDQQCRNVRMKQKLFWSCFFWISLLLKLPSNAKKNYCHPFFENVLGSMLVQHKHNPIRMKTALQKIFKAFH